MSKHIHKNFKSPEEVREFENGKVELLNFNDSVVGLITFHPGWKWSKHVKPIAGTELCEAPHFGYQLSGRLHVVMADGTEFEAVAGDVTNIPSGHDAWVVGDETVVIVDWAGVKEYGKKK